MKEAFKLGICEWSIPEKYRQEQFSFIRGKGLDGIELDTDKNGVIREGDLRLQQVSANERISAVALNGLGAYPMFTPSEEHRASMRRIFQNACAFASEKGVAILQVPCFYENALEKAQPQAAAALFRKMCDEAGEKGLKIALECTLNAVEILLLLKSVNRSNFGIYFDTANPVFFRHENPAQMLQVLSKHILQIHVKDVTADEIGKVKLGEGLAHFRECADIIVNEGAPDWIVLENMYGNTSAEEERLEADIALMKRYFR